MLELEPAELIFKLPNGLTVSYHLGLMQLASFIT
jgi:hypothetical protein